MYKRFMIAAWVTFGSVVFVSGQAAAPQRPVSGPAVSAVATQRAVIDQYCVVCHNQRLKTANLLLDQVDLTHLVNHAETAEKMVRKLRAGMMPPSGMPRPDPATREQLIVWLETELDRAAVTHVPPPGLHRLNRTEYSNAIRDLLGLEVDAAKFLPSDDSTHGFDNIAGALTMSPALMEAYLSAAAKISRLAIGNVTAPIQTVYTIAEDTSQNYHVEGLPFGTRGGMLIKHEFPADAEYVFKITPVNEGEMGQQNRPFGGITGEQLEVSVDGERVKLFDMDKEMVGFIVRTGVPTPRIPIRAGLHTIGVTFVATNYAPDYNINEVHLRTTIETGALPGLTFFPHIGKVAIDGPYDAKGATDTPSRRKIFVCHPTGAKDEEACARTIVSTLARRAFRRPPTATDVGTLMEFYVTGRNKGEDFDHGIERAVRRLLADPQFVYRGEPEPANVAPGKPYRISDLALASRLSFFLWSSIPDEELLTLAIQGKLRNPAVLEQQVQRLLVDPRSEAMVTNFIGQWLNVRALQDSHPVPTVYPDFDDTLRQSFRRETHLFFESIVREDRSILDLLTADYTFVDERLAHQYGIPNVYGSQFRRVTLGPELDMRRGLLGKGALLTVTSQAVRTSPVARGKWFLQTFLGVSPPDPPPNVPALKVKEADAAGNTKEPTMRQRMNEHHANPVCASCHKIFEPIGFALENFDGVGSWRTTEEGIPIDPAGEFVDGSKIGGPASLRELMQRYSPQFVRNVTERLLTYALGRGVEYQDMPLVRSIARDAADHNYRFSSLVLGIVKSVPFQMNMKAPETPQQAAR